MRTDNDTWDITTSVGSTALFVAAARALEAQKPHPLAVDPFAEVFCRAVGGEWADVLDGKARDNRLMSEFGGHFVTFQGARTRYFDAYFTSAAKAGVRQIVLLAAGLDSRAYRLPWADGTTVFELDQPRVLEFKREVLAPHAHARSTMGLAETPRAERREIAVDLRDDWPQALKDNGFDPTQPSAWIAEGLLIYLPAAAEQQLFAGIDSLASGGSRMALEQSPPMPKEDFEAKRDEEHAAGGDGDTFFTLVYNEQHAPAEQYFTSRGWTATVTRLPDYLRELGRPVADSSSEAGPMVESINLVSAVKG